MGHAEVLLRPMAVTTFDGQFSFKQEMIFGNKKNTVRCGKCPGGGGGGKRKNTKKHRKVVEWTRSVWEEDVDDLDIFLV